jgi:hypothetical protein
MSQQAAFALVLVLVAELCAAAVVTGLIWVPLHFIVKYW